MPQTHNLKLAIVGLGYVGLPLAAEFGKQYDTIGYDLSEAKIAHYQTHIDPTGEVSTEALKLAKRFVYAASSSTYGDHPGLPKFEDKIGKPLSPYAVTKYVNELYADVFARTYGFNTIGLRYFNVFGPRQDPDGAYAAVISKWIASMIKGEPIFINGDGETSRDFCFIENVRQINLLAAAASSPRPQGGITSDLAGVLVQPSRMASSSSEGLGERGLDAPREGEGLGEKVGLEESKGTGKSDPTNQIYNVAVGDRTTLNQLYEQLHLNLLPGYPHLQGAKPVYRDFRAGDVRHSLADISKAS